MHHYKEIINSYNLTNISNKELLEAINCFHEVFDYVEDKDKHLFWHTIRKFHEHIKGKHFDEMFAEYQVSHMYHTKKDGTVCRGEVFTIEQAKQVYERYVRNINPSYTYWDVYVALNAQYHDYAKLYQEWFDRDAKDILKDKVIQAAIIFWFQDEDAGEGKVWNYFKDMD